MRTEAKLAVLSTGALGTGAKAWNKAPTRARFCNKSHVAAGENKHNECGADSIENTSSAQMKQVGARLLSPIGIASVGVIESSEPEAPCELAVAETFFSRKPKAPLVKHDG